MSTPEMITVDKALELYESNVNENYDGAIPIFLYATKDAFVPVAISGGMPEGGMQEVLMTLIPKLIREHGKPVWMCLSSECWMRTDMTPEFAENQKYGDLTRDRESGDLGVMEGIQITGISADTEWMVTKPFERVGGQTFWGEVVRSDTFTNPGRIEGGVPDILRRALTIPDEIVDMIRDSQAIAQAIIDACDEQLDNDK